MTALQGEHTVGAAPPELWERLSDPAVLAAAVPGCRDLARVGPGEVRVAADGGAGPLRGTWAGTVGVREATAPRRAVLDVDLAGEPGSASGRVTVELTGDGEGGTRVDWDADVHLEGMPARIGGRLVRSMAARAADELLEAAVSHEPPADASAPSGPEHRPRARPTAVEPARAPAGDGRETRRLVAAFLVGVLVTLVGVAARRRRG